MELSNAVLAAALGAALMNAGWNSAIKLGGDKMVAMALTTGLASLWSLLQPGPAAVRPAAGPAR